MNLKELECGVEWIQLAKGPSYGLLWKR